MISPNCWKTAPRAFFFCSLNLLCPKSLKDGILRDISNTLVSTYLINSPDIHGGKAISSYEREAFVVKSRERRLVTICCKQNSGDSH
ncbi:hypothetical protein CEXT_228371 [Caerostris extrusa]|uniref:Secreted protein n=1 Tax=Caerostris extrusa TaxID=172846 RepID=A0AAV4VUB1_CAEEX|nr:hypothetical protein CEXT_228371 [Caerostris extrusa]